MPEINQTGPARQGPMTGRRISRCTNFSAGHRNIIHQVNENPSPDHSENSFRREFGPEHVWIGPGFGMGKVAVAEIVP